MPLLLQGPQRQVAELGHRLKPKPRLVLEPFVQLLIIALQRLQLFEQQLHQLVPPQRQLAQEQRIVHLRFG